MIRWIRLMWYQFGRFMSSIKDEFYKTKLEYENITDWCVRKALEELR